MVGEKEEGEGAEKWKRTESEGEKVEGKKSEEEEK